MNKRDLAHLEKEQLLLGVPEERMFEHTGGGGAGLRLSADHLLNQVLCYDVIWIWGRNGLQIFMYYIMSEYSCAKHNLHHYSVKFCNYSNVWKLYVNHKEIVII